MWQWGIDLEQYENCVGIFEELFPYCDIGRIEVLLENSQFIGPSWNTRRIGLLDKESQKWWFDLFGLDC